MTCRINAILSIDKGENTVLNGRCLWKIVKISRKITLKKNVYVEEECLKMDFQRTMYACVSPELPMFVSSEGNLFSLKIDFWVQLVFQIICFVAHIV